MTNDFDDEVLDVENEASFDEFDKKKTLGDLWRDNPLVKIGIIVGAAVIIFGTIIFFGGGSKPVDPSFVPASPEVASAPGSDEVSPVYKNAVEEENEARVEQAQKEGTSALPTPINPPSEGLSLPDQQPATEDPLQRWRQLQEERLQREAGQPASTTAPNPAVAEAQQKAVADKEAAIQSLSSTMGQQMQSILDSRAEKPIGYRALTSMDWLTQQKEKQIQTTAAATNANSSITNEEIQVILFPAGEIAYAQLITEANSDAPGPVVAQINSGPLRGSRVLGDFKVQENADLLTLQFDTIIVKGVSQDINAVGLDPNTTLPAMATDVDHRYLERIALPAAAAFVQGAASAISDSGLTTITINGDTVTSEQEETNTKQDISSGIDEAGQEVRTLIDEELDKVKTRIRIEKGTPIGVLFLEPVLDPNSEIQ